MCSHLRIIVTGQIAQYPLGGVTWFYIQYVIGLQKLGHDVYYFEDSGQWPYNPGADGLIVDCSFNVEYLAEVMSRFGLDNKWAYRLPWESKWFGLTERERAEVLQTAELLINVSGTLETPQEYRAVKRLAYIDTDPVFTQVKLLRGQADFQKLVDAHDVHFSYGECLSSGLANTGHEWHPTRAPIVLDEWNPAREHRSVFTTVMNWTSHNSVTYQGKTYGQKNSEFEKFLDLPRLVAPTQLELAIGSGKNQRTPYDLLRHHGWNLVKPSEVCANLESFRDYTQASKAEWGVAKNGYVAGQSGWFSERSARYLAAGRPVVVQDTGFTKVLKTGEGILPFSNLQEAAAAIEDVEVNYERHAAAARGIAEEFFDSRKVLSRLVAEAND